MAREGLAPERPPADDSVAFWLKFAIFSVVIVALASAIWALASGMLRPGLPRTALEAKLTLASEVAATNPSSARAWADYIDALVQTHQYRKAAAVLDQARGSITEDGVSYLNNSELKLLFAQGRYEDVITTAEEAIKQDDALRAKKAAELAKRGITSAEQSVDTANVTEAWLLKAKAQGSLGQWEGAVESLTKALVFDPTAADMLTMRGQAYAKLGKNQSARADFEKALEYIPDWEAARQGLEALGVQP